MTNLQGAEQRALPEIGSQRHAMAEMLRASAALQMLSNALNALRHAAPLLARMLRRGAPLVTRTQPNLTAFWAAFVPVLTECECGCLTFGDAVVARLRADIPAPDGSVEVAVLMQALDHL